VVVADRVVDEVGDEAPDETRIPGRHRRRQVSGEDDAPLGRLLAAGGEHSRGDLGQVEGIPAGARAG
jgi:hypothetical protein